MFVDVGSAVVDVVVDVVVDNAVVVVVVDVVVVVELQPLFKPRLHHLRLQCRIFKHVFVYKTG